MQVVLLNLPERDAFALSLLIGRMQPVWRCQAARGGQVLPGDLVVLDLVNLIDGDDVSPAVLDERLHAVVGNRAAVLLTPPP